VMDEHGGNFGGVGGAVGLGSGCIDGLIFGGAVGLGSGCFSGRFSRGDGGGRVAFVGCCSGGFSKGDGDGGGFFCGLLFCTGDF
jgi:hypothetical protein